jgi:phage terminase large subunit-like protein
MRGGRDVILPSLHCVSVIASSYENLSNLSGSYLNVLKAFENTSDAKAEIYGIIPTSDPDALWRPEYITYVRPEDVEPFRVIAIAVDPAGVTTGECGIVLAGLNDAGSRCYVFGDVTCSGDPAVWSRRAIEAYMNCTPQIGVYIIVEKNYGGGQARLVLENAAREMGVRPVIVEIEARQSKLGRAHPVSLLYQQQKVVHVGIFPQLETELCTFTGAQNQRSPNRMDAMVHAVGHLMLSGVKIYGRDFGLY